MDFSNLPDEVKNSVLGFVKKDTYLILGSVCKEFSSAFDPEDRQTSSVKYLESLELFEHSLVIEVPHEDNVVENLGRLDTPEGIPLALRTGYDWDHFCVEDAAIHGREDFFTWLKTTDLFWLPENAYYAAAEVGNLEIVEFLLSNGMGYPDTRALQVAVRKGHREVSEKLAELSLDQGYHMSVAIRTNDVDTVKRLKASNVKFGYKCVQEVCVNGSTEVFEFLEKHNVYPTREEFLMAVEFGHTELVGLFYTFFSELVDSTSISVALGRGQKEMVRFLLEIGVPCDSYVDDLLTGDDVWD